MFLALQKVDQLARIGLRGERHFGAMPERKHSFFRDPFLMFKTSIGSRDRSARDPPMQWLPAAKSRDRRRCRRAAIARLASRLLFTSLVQRKILSRWEDTAVSSRACSEKRCGWVSTEKDEWGLLLPATLWTWRQVCPRSWEGRRSCGWRPPGARCLPRWTRSRQRGGATWVDPWRTEYCQQKR